MDLKKLVEQIGLIERLAGLLSEDQREKFRELAQEKIEYYNEINNRVNVARKEVEDVDKPKD
jgi:hypothetical protein